MPMINSAYVKYANVIIDISHEKVDRVFQYRIPVHLQREILVGTPVLVPFGRGNKIRSAYVVELTDQSDYDEHKIKLIADLARTEISVESQLICLAWWMKESYGSTMNQALKTVLPVKQKVRQKEQRLIKCRLEGDLLKHEIARAEARHFHARARLLRLFLTAPVYSYEQIRKQTGVAMAGIQPLIDQRILELERNMVFRNPVSNRQNTGSGVQLNGQQNVIVRDFCTKFDQGIRQTALIHGITGSGKTEVYLGMISHILAKGKQAIVLIPEIALTYQTVERFYQRFGERVSIINSRLSKGERYDQFERAKNGTVSVMIGPRSALFTPFPDLGLIIIDEEHEGAYKSEVVPRYHARETAGKRAQLSGASLIMGSATPSMEAYTRALSGEYILYQLNQRAKEASHLPAVEVVDLRKELEQGNKTIFSVKLQGHIRERLNNKEQIMLFINRRGYSNFVSCRSCGTAMKCPHCDVSLTLHNHGHLVCHYCGYQISLPKQCPICTSSYIAQFGVGTQKLEEMTRMMFPDARILRMDHDTTSRKGGHEQILEAFQKQQADILIGTQMIVKGHDFPNVTLVGVMAADLSLHESDYRSAERTFQLLTQAAGRAGRASKRGDVVIQTYQPEHYSITTASNQDYQSFYHQELTYRSLLSYPPVIHLLMVQFAAADEQKMDRAVGLLLGQLAGLVSESGIQMIGPVNASVYKVNDIYRKILYMKQEKYDILIGIKERMDLWMTQIEEFQSVTVQYDFS